MTVVNEIVGRHPEARIEPINDSKPSLCDPEHEMMKIIQANVRSLGRPEPAPILSLGGTDARLWRLAGIPAFVHGPFPRGMGQGNENVDVDEYLDIVRAHVLSAFDYLTS